MEKVSLELSRKEELSETAKNFPVFCEDAVKNACDDVATAF